MNMSRFGDTGTGPTRPWPSRTRWSTRGIDALAAYRDGRLTQREYVRVVRTARRRMIAAGVEDLSLRGNHMLLSIDREQKLAVDDKNLPLIRICNFELLRKIEQSIEHQ